MRKFILILFFFFIWLKYFCGEKKKKKTLPFSALFYEQSLYTSPPLSLLLQVFLKPDLLQHTTIQWTSYKNILLKEKKKKKRIILLKISRLFNKNICDNYMYLTQMRTL